MANYHPLVSIIINTHNNIDYLPAAIESAYSQTYPNTEIIVYDNASTDDIRGLVQQYDERLRYFRSETFLSLGQARNEAVKEAKGELIDFLDADDLFLPTKLERQVPLFEKANVGLVICNIWIFKTVDGEVKERLYYHTPPPEGKVFSELLKKNFISFAASMIRKDAMGQDPSHWFPEQFNVCTDFDLFLRISYDYEVRYVDETLAKWRKHDKNWSIVKLYLLSAEKMMMLGRMLDYEPQLFQEYSSEAKQFLTHVYCDQLNYYWGKKFKHEAILSAFHAFFLSFQVKHLLKVILILFGDYTLMQKLRTFLNKDPFSLS